jgi:erythromycin esterase-like protein
VKKLLKTDQLIDYINQYAVTFSSANELKPLIKEASQAKYVLLGEASHGTHEFYTIRSNLTKELIQKHGFSFIAVEGDWPACYEVNRYIKGMASEYHSAEDVLKKSFNRWPSWMWANQEIVELIDWLHSYNQTITGKKIGFYGLDVYSLWESMEAIVEYLEKIKSPDLEKALQAIECFDPYERKPEKYGISAAFYDENCLNEILELLITITGNKKMDHSNSESALNMNINAIVASNAEHYYHTMVTNDIESWNIRDRHMVEALHYIGDFYGPKTKGVIWEHNTHIGDARATDMATEGMVNVGQLTREKYGHQSIYAIGLGTHHGTVIAAEKWGEQPKVMPVPDGFKESWEETMHKANTCNQYLMFTEENKEFFHNVIGHRAIGVVYHPKYERHGNYVPSRLSERYNAFIHIEETTALSPL